MDRTRLRFSMPQEPPREGKRTDPSKEKANTRVMSSCILDYSQIVTYDHLSILMND